jgi:hypothetical protein
MKAAFAEIVERSIMMFPSRLLCNQASKVRLDAIMKLLVEFLNVPALSSMLGTGILYVMSGNNSENTNATHQDNKSASPSTMLRSLQQFVVDGFMLFAITEEALSSLSQNYGDDASYDTQRASLAAKLIRFRLSPVVATFMTLDTFTPPALIHMTCHLLGVRALSSRITKVINKEMARYKSIMCSDRNPVSMADFEAVLQAEVSKYFAWARRNKDDLIRESRNMEIITSVNPKVRAWLKGEEYASSRHLVRVFHQQYKKHLTHMPMPLHPLQNKDIAQALKDLRREAVFVNKRLYQSGSKVGAGSMGEVGSSKIDLSFLSAGMKKDLALRQRGISDEDVYDLDDSSVNITDNHADDIQIETVQAVAVEIVKTLTFLSGDDDLGVWVPISQAKLQSNVSTDGRTSAASTPTVHPSALPARGLPVTLSPNPRGTYENAAIDAVKSLSPGKAIDALTSGENDPLEYAKDDRMEGVLGSIRQVDLNLKRLPSSQSTSSTDNTVRSTGSTDVPTFNMMRCTGASSPVGDDNDTEPPEGDPNADSDSLVSEDLTATPTLSPTPSKSTRKALNSETDGGADTSSPHTLTWKQHLLKLLMNYTLLAMCRSIAGGDAYIVLNDLYGGEGVMLCPCAAMFRKSSPSKGSSARLKYDERYFTTEVTVGGSGIKVVVRECYNLLPECAPSLAANGHSSLDIEPLATFVCTTTTLINLAIVAEEREWAGGMSQPTNIDSKKAALKKLAAQSIRGAKAAKDDIERFGGMSLLFGLFKKLLTAPETLCRRAITIEPIEL